ncbi:MAG: sigma-70 family RNA polymerase sigma factor [Clostridium sp.]|uniref:sigma-70 family RNA polymerase sigma factor n=1 Tax=Clostridium sp. TaxID=1506 RepID=UPI003F3EA408
MENEELLEMLRKKDEKGVEMAISMYSNLLFKVAYSVLLNREQSEEVVNDVFLKMYLNIDKFSGDVNKFKNWLCTISKYTAIDKMRQEKKYKNSVDIENMNLCEKEDILENEIKREELEKVRNFINEMKKVDREIFIRRFYNDEKISSIAKTVHMSENAVTLRILRGRKRISEFLEGGNING